MLKQIDEDDQEHFIHFQQDGALPHYLTEVQDFLNNRLPGTWIEQDGLIAWPPCLPDPKHLNFFLILEICQG